MSARGSDGHSRCPATAVQSAAAPSPFPPIADYAFLSDCHTGALVAPDGALDWLCVPRFDAPSVFGMLLDRGAGTFRLGPFGINHPTARAYEPGTNTLVTTWKTPTGWVEIRDALTVGPRHGVDTVTPHTRPPADTDAEHMLVRTARCLDGTVEIELVCEPVFDYGREPAEWTIDDDDCTRRTRPAPGRRSGCAPTWRSGSRATGCARATCCTAARCSSARCRGPRSWRPRPTPTTRAPGWRRRTASGASGWAGRAYRTTGSATRCSVRRWRSRASPTCRPARPWRRSPRRCPRRPAASATGTTATRGCATRRSRCRRCTG